MTSVLTLCIGLFGFWLAAFIDASGTTRANQLQCTDSVLSLRSSLVALRRGYEVAPTDKPIRLADWDEVGFAMDRVNYTCEPTLSQSATVFEAYGELQRSMSGELAVADQGQWDERNTLAMVAWTGSALKYMAG